MAMLMNRTARLPCDNGSPEGPPVSASIEAAAPQTGGRPFDLLAPLVSLISLMFLLAL